MIVEIKTISHPWTDHKAIMYTLKGEEVNKNTKETRKFFPKRALKVPNIKKALGELFEKLLPVVDNKVPNIIEKWDKMKKIAFKLGCKMWEDHIRKRGKMLKEAKYKANRAIRMFRLCPGNHPAREKIQKIAQERQAQWFQELENSMWAKSAANEKRKILVNGKVNKEFFSKQRSTRKSIRNMTIDNIPGDPSLQRTNDTNIIMDNFVKYYTVLYEDKEIDEGILTEMLNNVKIPINKRWAELMGSPITEEEVMQTLVHFPTTSPGEDGIPYSYWATNPRIAANRLAIIANKIGTGKYMPKSMRRVLITTLPKEQDSYSTNLYRPISLLNTDYKIITKVWSNRMGPMLNDIIGEHQRGFIPRRDGRENILKTQILHDYYSWKGRTIPFLRPRKSI